MVKRASGPGVSFFAFQDIITAVVGIFILITLILVLELAERFETAAAPPTADAEVILDSLKALEQEIERMSAELQRRLDAQSESADINEFNRQQKLDQATASIAMLNQQIDSLDQRNAELRQKIEEAERTGTRLLAEAADQEKNRPVIEHLREKRREIQQRLAQLETEDSPIYRDTTADGRHITLILLEDRAIELSDARTKSVRTFTGNRRVQELEQWLNNNDLSSRQLFLVLKPGTADDFKRIQRSLDSNRAVYGFTLGAVDYRVRLAFETSSRPGEVTE